MHAGSTHDSTAFLPTSLHALLFAAKKTSSNQIHFPNSDRLFYFRGANKGEKLLE
jgi:hypothetical protein